MFFSQKVFLPTFFGAIALLAATIAPAPAQMTAEQVREITGVNPYNLDLGGKTLAEWQQDSSLSQAQALGFPLSRTDIVFGNIEGGIDRTISGSYEEGFAVPCYRNCAHIELGAPYTGFRWVSGLSQQVNGGHGIMGQINDGLEPTGRHPFGSAVKVVLLETNEATGTAQLGLYFRTCVRRPIDLGCSPYFIGPLPWLTIREEDFVIL